MASPKEVRATSVVSAENFYARNKQTAVGQVPAGVVDTLHVDPQGHTEHDVSAPRHPALQALDVFVSGLSPRRAGAVALLETHYRNAFIARLETKGQKDRTQDGIPVEIDEALTDVDGVLFEGASIAQQVRSAVLLDLNERRLQHASPNEERSAQALSGGRINSRNRHAPGRAPQTSSLSDNDLLAHVAAIIAANGGDFTAMQLQNAGVYDLIRERFGYQELRDQFGLGKRPRGGASHIRKPKAADTSPNVTELVGEETSAKTTAHVTTGSSRAGKARVDQETRKHEIDGALAELKKLAALGVPTDYFGMCRAGHEEVARRIQTFIGFGAPLAKLLNPGSPEGSGSSGTRSHPEPEDTSERKAARRILLVPDEWSNLARCKGSDPEELFVLGADQKRTKVICRGCAVRGHCGAYAIENGIEHGVWGGMTERERRAAIKKAKGTKRGVDGLVIFLRNEGEQALTVQYSL